MKNKLLDIFLICFGNFLLAVSVVYFVLPFQLLSGGVAGIAVITYKLFGINETLMINILVIGLFILGYLFLGKEFAAKTALSSAVYPIFIYILQRFPYDVPCSRLLAVVYGSVISGIGLGIAFSRNASTGGMDVPVLILHKYTGISISSLILITDIITALAGAVAYSIEDVMIGIIYIYISSEAVNKAMVPMMNQAVALYIISEHYSDIISYIHEKLYRGSTIIQAQGGFTGSERKVILTVIKRSQYVQLSEYISKTDPYAFVIVSDAKEIKGEGFTYEYRV